MTVLEFLGSPHSVTVDEVVLETIRENTKFLTITGILHLASGGSSQVQVDET